jgi:hypothetical protein
MKSVLTIILMLQITIGFGQNCTPNLKEIFSFPEKSVFQYRTTISHESPYQEIIVEKYTIDNKWWTGDTLFYTRKGYRESSVYWIRKDIYEEPSIETINDTITIIEKPGHYLNACDGQLIQFNSNNNYYTYVNVEDSTKILGGVDNLYTYDQNDSLIKLDLRTNHGYNYKQIYKYGIGLYFNTVGNIMYAKTTKLEGYVINGDTIGTIND